MTLSQVINAVPALNKVSSTPISLFLSYKVKKLLNTIQGDVDFFNEKQQELVEKYGYIKDDNSYVIDEDKKQVFQIEMNELAQMQVDIQVEKIALPIDSPIELSVIEIGSLEPFITFVE